MSRHRNCEPDPGAYQGGLLDSARDLEDLTRWWPTDHRCSKPCRIPQSHVVGSWTTAEPNQNAVRARPGVHADRSFGLCGRLFSEGLSPSRFSRSEFLSF